MRYLEAQRRQQVAAVYFRYAEEAWAESCRRWVTTPATDDRDFALVMLYKTMARTFVQTRPDDVAQNLDTVYYWARLLGHAAHQMMAGE